MKKAYIAWHRDANILKRCTSGGVASAIAEVVLDAGGIAIGASYCEGMQVKHVVVEDKAELYRIRGVKYVHSKMDKGIYDGIEYALTAGRKVFFCGLPCQAAALRKRFGFANNLLIADLICYGAPPQSLWLKYVAWLESERGKRLIYLNPRDKKKGWGEKTYYRYFWGDGSTQCKLSLYDPYSQAFYSAIAFRRCCYDCKFKGENRKSDITLGDFIGAEKLNLDPNVVRRGVSAVICHTMKGVEAIAKCAVTTQEVAIENIVSNNLFYKRSAEMPHLWGAFAYDSVSQSFGSIVKKYGLQISKTSRVVKRVIMAFLRTLHIVAKVIGLR